jgi:hypothetical protein
MEMLRKSGSTTKMLNDAYNFYQKGYNVIILGYNQRQIDYFKEMLPPETTEKITISYNNNTGEYSEHTIISNKITFKTFSLNDVDFAHGMGHCVILVDHYVMEQFMSCTQSGYSLFTPIEYSVFIQRQQQIKHDREQLNKIREILKA